MGKKRINNGHLSEKEQKIVHTHLKQSLLVLEDLTQQGYVLLVGNKKKLDVPSILFVEQNGSGQTGTVRYLMITEDNSEAYSPRGDPDFCDALPELMERGKFWRVNSSDDVKKVLEARIAGALYKSRGHKRFYPI